MTMLDDKHVAREKGAKPDDDWPIAERFPTDHEIAEKLDISVEAARALVKASLRSS
jgi:hypothetical protein